MGRSAVFSAVEQAKCSASVFRLHYLPAIAAGVDGGGQTENMMQRQVAIDNRVVEPIRSTAFGSRRAKGNKMFFIFNQR